MSSEHRSDEALPGKPETVEARRVLVLAPHYDDEILGCGGLLADLLERGADVVVVYLSDSAASGDLPGREEVARRRRQEAAAVEALFGWRSEHLELTDGRLEVGAVTDALAELVATHLPDLVLAPSPIEVSADHRAAARAVYDLLHTQRPEGPVQQLCYYEVNQPLRPNLLVDVSRWLPRLETAMELYASQQELHDYRRAGIGLRRYRTHTLEPAVEAAEAYLRLTRAEVGSLGWSALCERARGQSRTRVETQRPRVGVVVRTRDRQELLQQALESLASSRMPAHEVVVVNDGGALDPLGSDWPFRLFRIDHPAPRGRAAAANSGVAALVSEAIAFLDDDDRVLEEHLEVLAGAVAAPGVEVAYTDAAVVTYGLDPAGAGWVEEERRRPYSRDFDRALLLVDNYIPFHTLLVPRRLHQEVGPFDEELDLFEDWDFLIRLTVSATPRHIPRVTCEYRHFRGMSSHALAGQDDADRRERFMRHKARVLEKHRARLDSDQLAQAIVALRRGCVDGEERVHALEQRAESQRRESLRRQRQLEQSTEEHRATTERLRLERDLAESARAEAHGERESLRAELGQRDDELRAQYRHADELRQALEDHRRHIEQLDDDRGRAGEQMEALHAEIGRLTLELEQQQRLLAEMQATRAWRWHRRIESWRGRGG